MMEEPRKRCATEEKAENLSFAVELKFLVQQRRDNVDDPTIRPFVPHQPAALRNSMTKSEIRLSQERWEAIAHALDTLRNVDALTGHQIRERGLTNTNYWQTHWIVYKSHSAVPPYVGYQNDDAENPVLDTTYPDYDTYLWIPVEVCSPVLPWPVRGEDQASSGQGALRILRNVLETIHSGECGAVFVNHSTETHVHVGRRDGRLPSLGTCKRLATLAWLAEPILRGVKDPKSPNFDHVYTWSSPLRRHSRLGKVLWQHQCAQAMQSASNNGGDWKGVYEALPRGGDSRDFTGFIAGVSKKAAAKRRISVIPETRHGNDMALQNLDDLDRRALEAIWTAQSHQELGHMLSGSERRYQRLGFNFHSLEQGDEEGSSNGSPRTVEFRFLEGFIDTQIVLAWVQVCGEMVALAAEQVDSDEFYAVVAALLLTLAEDLPLDVKFRHLMEAFGAHRISRSVWEPLQAVIRKNFPPAG